MLAATDEKVRDLIKPRELVAFDISLHAGGKPRYRISQTDLEDFDSVGLGKTWIGKKLLETDRPSPRLSWIPLVGCRLLEQADR